jgi:hypothetical protein
VGNQTWCSAYNEESLSQPPIKPHIRYYGSDATIYIQYEAFAEELLSQRLDGLSKFNV